MKFKGIICALCALLVAAGSASAATLVKCKSAKGTLDPLGIEMELNFIFSTEGYIIGNFTFGEKTYFAFGSTMDIDDPEIDVDIFFNGARRGELEVMYEADKGTCNGTLEHEGKKYDVEMTIRSNGTMENPFEPADLDDFNNYNVFRYQVEMGEYFFAKNIILVKDKNGFAFRIAGTSADGYGTVRNFQDGDWTVLPYKNGTITYKDPYDDVYEIKVYKNFVMCSCPTAEEESDTKAVIASGMFMSYATDNIFNKTWLYPEGEEAMAEEDRNEGGALTDYWPRWNYPDVEDIRTHIKEGDLDEVTIEVDLEGAEKPNIVTYLRAVAKTFNKGMLAEALLASYGKAANIDTEWTLDTRNGYLKCILPDDSGNEGIEMCFWRGKDGKDVVALNMRYVGCDPNNEYDSRQSYLGVFFRYFPASKHLQAMSTNGSDMYSFSQWSESYNVFPDDAEDIYYMKLPREGKTIEFRTVIDDVKHALQWNAEKQWFDWIK